MFGGVLEYADRFETLLNILDFKIKQLENQVQKMVRKLEDVPHFQRENHTRVMKSFEKLELSVSEKSDTEMPTIEKWSEIAYETSLSHTPRSTQLT